MTKRTEERAAHTMTGYVPFVIALAAMLAAAADLMSGTLHNNLTLVPTIFWIAVAALAVVTMGGLYMLQPNEGAILTLFGSYSGTDRSAGLRWTNPLNRRSRISLRAYNFATDKIKVNDQRGNPIEIAAAIVWRVENTAQAVFDIDNYENYVRVQAEAAVRHLASRYPYDEGMDEHDVEKNRVTLRAGTDQVTQSLMSELSDRLDIAGIRIEDAKLTHLAYAPEIAGVMLRRQQAEAIIAARAKIVSGAVSMVEMALKGLSERHIIELDDERKASMVSNLLVVLCSENEVQLWSTQAPSTTEPAMENVAYYRHRQIGWTMIISALIPLFVLFVFGHLASADSQASRALGLARPMFLIALAVPLIAVALFSSLLVSLDQSMLTLRFGPGGLIKKSWPLASIERAEATRTTWTQGWGIHRQGGVTLYNVSGFGAVRITLKDGASALIGSDEPQALAMSIERLVQERR